MHCISVIVVSQLPLWRSVTMLTLLITTIGITLAENEAILQLPPTAQRDMRSSSTDCVAKVSKKNFPAHGSVIVSLATKSPHENITSDVYTDRLLLGKLFREKNWSIMVKKANVAHYNKIQFFKKADAYILQVRSERDFMNNLKQLTELLSWNPNARFLVLFNEIIDNAMNAAGFIIEHLWTRQVINAIIMMPKKADPSIMIFYSWFPYNPEHCVDKFNELAPAGTCKYGRMSAFMPLYPNKVPPNMYGCTINVHALIWPPYVMEPKYDRCGKTFIMEGLEVKLLEVISEAMNFKIGYGLSKRSEMGMLYPNKTATGIFKLLMSQNVDLAIGSIAPSNERHDMFDFTMSYMNEAVAWVVPYASTIPHWKNVLILFQPSTWVAVLSAYIIMSFVIWYMCRDITDEWLSYRIYSRTNLNVFSILLGAAVHILPKTFRARILLLLWVFFSLHADTAYHTSLISVLTQPSYEAQVSNLDQLFESKLKLGILKSTERYLRDSEDPRFTKLMKDVVICDDVAPCLSRVAYQRDFALALPRLFIEFTSSRYVNRKGQPLLHVFKEDVVSYPIEMLASKGYPLIPKINAVILKIKSSGLIAKWKSDIVKTIKSFEKLMDNGDTEDDDDDDELTALTVSHLQGAFMLLVIGLVISVLVFLFEIAAFRRRMLQ